MRIKKSSPSDEFRLREEAKNARLLTLAAERMERHGPAALIPEEKVWERLGATQADLDSIGEAKFK